MMTTNEMITYDMIVELGIATADEINLAFNIAQTTWTELLNRVVYAKTGYRTLEDYMESEDEEDWKSPLLVWIIAQKDPKIFVYFAYCN